tara:strand:- start:45 stop:266 length:222 start_codon:yes stop_codon:yes gene_type:complete
MEHQIQPDQPSAVGAGELLLQAILQFRKIFRQHQQCHSHQTEASSQVCIPMHLKGACCLQMLSPGQPHEEADA